MQSIYDSEGPDSSGCHLMGSATYEGINTALGYNGNKSFVDVAGVIFRGYNGCGCAMEDMGLANAREGNTVTEMNIRSGSWSSFFLRDSSDYSTLIHESGHAVFGLREEYCTNGVQEDTSYHSNTFNSLEACQKNTAHSNKSDCKSIPSKVDNICGQGTWKADFDDDAMNLGNGTQFDADCQRRAQCMIDGLAQAECR